MIVLLITIIGTFLLGGYAIRKGQELEKKQKEMRRLIYDMYYADEISVEIAERLLERLEKVRNKRRRY